MASTPKPKIVKAVEAPEREVVREARKQIEILIERRDNTAANLNTTMSNAKTMEQQAFMLRGAISAYEEQIETLRKRHGIKEKVQ